MSKQGHINILVVEDRGELRVMLRDLFELLGYDVVVAPGGEVALELIYHAPDPELMISPFDLVILDLGLPDLDGLEVLRRMRDRNITIPVLIFTADGEQEKILQAFELGAADFVTKPVHAEELLARVEAILRRTNPEWKPTMKVSMLDEAQPSG